MLSIPEDSLLVFMDNPDEFRTHDKITCRCDCGNVKRIRKGHVLQGRTRSCGCMLKDFIKETKTTHGLTGTRQYNIWASMRSRCYKPSSDNYKYYGAKGITVCSRWNESFICFWEDMGEGYREGLTIDRVDPEKGYCKENCRWVTQEQNCHNRRGNSVASSRYKGVHWCKRRLKWTAVVSYKGETHWLGRFTEESDAAAAYNTKAKELFGEFAYLNKMEGVINESN